jgi:hypothetical protein
MRAWLITILRNQILFHVPQATQRCPRCGWSLHATDAYPAKSCRLRGPSRTHRGDRQTVQRDARSRHPGRGKASPIRRRLGSAVVLLGLSEVASIGLAPTLQRCAQSRARSILPQIPRCNRSRFVQTPRDPLYALTFRDRSEIHSQKEVASRIDLTAGKRLNRRCCLRSDNRGQSDRAAPSSM